ncbi:MAG: DUF192 domain-containing protein [Patescibacteria group bacterium]
MNYRFSALISLLALIALFFLVKSQFRNEDKPPTEDEVIFLEIGSTRVNLEIANTAQTRRDGLGGRGELKEGWGMFFVFEEPDRYPFWMKDVSFPLDIVWISEDWQISGVEQNVLPSSYPTTFRSTRPVLYVLEVNAGFVKDNQIEVGSFVKLVETIP